MPTDGRYNLFFIIYLHLISFRVNLISSTFLICIIYLPWSVSTAGVDSPCGNGGKFDTITCSHNNKLILTLGDDYFEGDCSDYPFYVYSEGRAIYNRKTKILATVVDTNEVIYFFEDERVILYDGARRYDKKIGKVFTHFVGKVNHAVVIPNPEVEGPRVPCLLVLYTNSRIFYYGERTTTNGLPIWSEIKDLWDMKSQTIQLNSTMPKVSLLIGVTGNIVKTILNSPDDKENLTYFTARIRSCGSKIYRFHFFDCLQENEELGEKLIQGQLIECLTTHQSVFNLMTLMLWGSLLLIILAMLGLLKCTIYWFVKKFRRSKRKVRFVENSYKGDPKPRNHVFTYVVESPQRIQSFDFDSMAQSAVSINDDYKDIDYSSDLEEEKITLQESDLKPPLESIQSSNVI